MYPAATVTATLPALDQSIPVDFPVDELVRLQLRIARRADELAQLQEHDVACG